MLSGFRALSGPIGFFALSSSLPTSPAFIGKMLRQLASGPSRAARLAIRVRHTTASSSASAAGTATPLFQTATPFRSAAATALRQRQALSVGRWYSSETDAPKPETGDAAAASKESEAAESTSEPLNATDAAALRKDLEGKTKEVLEWKVRSSRLYGFYM